VAAAKGNLHQSKLATFLSRGVKSKTSKGHTRNYSAWTQFLDRSNKSEFMLLDGLSDFQRRELVVTFIHDLKAEQNKSSGEISRALQSLQWFLAINNRDVLWFRHDKSIALARRACAPSARELNIAREKRKRLPVSVDMVLWIEEKFSSESVDSFMTVIGILIAFHFILRVSEYVAHAENEHAILCGDVAFITYEGDRVAPWEIGSGRFTFAQIESILIVIRSAKQDKDGKGRHLYISRDSKAEIHLMQQIFSWCEVANHQDDLDPLLSRYASNRRKKLTPGMVNAMLKTMATAFGFDEAHFSTHCIKIGAATVLAMAQVNPEIIRRIAGWSEEARSNQIYSQNTPIDRGSFSVFDTGVRLLSAKDVKRMLPTRVRNR
jgi:hypothetical protein